MPQKEGQRIPWSNFPPLNNLELPQLSLKEWILNLHKAIFVFMGLSSETGLGGEQGLTAFSADLVQKHPRDAP